MNAILEQTSLDDLSSAVIGAAIEVHRELGPGLLESAYEDCLAWELGNQGLPVERRLPIPLIYKGHKVAEGCRLDLPVDKRVIVELNRGCLSTHPYGTNADLFETHRPFRWGCCSTSRWM